MRNRHAIRVCFRVRIDVAIVETYVDASEDDAWSVLNDGTLYADWVVGAKRIRMEEGAFPRPGSGFHHTIGVGPVTVNDDTRVVESPDPRSIKLDAGMGLLGRADVEIWVRPEGDGIRIKMYEAPREGITKILHNPLIDRILWARNVLSLRRLRQLIEGGQHE